MEQEDYSKLTTNQKKELLSKTKTKDLDELILNGLTIKLDEIRRIHNENIPLSFYSNFGISINDSLLALIGLSQEPMNVQILEAILTEDIEIRTVQKFLTTYTNKYSTEDLNKIKEKYNIFETPNLKPRGSDFDDDDDDDKFDTFVDLFINCLAEDMVETAYLKRLTKIIYYLLEQDESHNWNFSPVLDSAIDHGIFSLMKKLLERGVVPNGMIFFSENVPDPKVFDFLSEYLGRDKVYEILLKIFEHYKQYDLKSTIIIMDYMSNIKDADQVIADIKKVQSLKK